MSKASSKTQKIVTTAVLAAVTVVISFLPIRTLGLEITLSMVPVAVGAVLCGPAAGAALGGVFGIVSFLQCLGYSPFGAVMLSINPYFTFIVCIPTRTLAGYLAGVIFSLFKRKEKTPLYGYIVSCLVAPLLNTLFFMSTLVLSFYNTDYIQGFVTALHAANPFIFVLLFVGINGLVEIICGFVAAVPISKALSKAIK